MFRVNLSIPHLRENQDLQIKLLHAAACLKQIDALKYLLWIGVDANLKNDRGLTPLQNVLDLCENDSHYKVCKKLIAKGASLNITVPNGSTPLHQSMSKPNNIKVVELLLRNGVCVNVKSGPTVGITALHQVSALNNQEYVELLISKGALIDETDEYGRTPLLFATTCCENNSHLPILRLLLDNNADPNAKDKLGRSSLHSILHDTNAIVHANNRQTISLLLNNVADANLKTYHGETALHFVSNYNHPEYVELLLSKGALINETDKVGRTPLVYATLACKNNSHFPIIKLLLANNADSNFQGIEKTTPLLGLLYTSDNDIVRKNGKTISFLLDNGADVNKKDCYGVTALHRLALQNNLEYVELLLSKGALINTKDKNGKTPLHYATSACKNNSHFTIIKLLLANNANPNAQDENKNTPLHTIYINIKAACNDALSNSQTISLLLNSGVDVKIKNSVGETALHEAAGVNHQDYVELLISKGAHINAINECGSTPLHYATMACKNNSHLSFIRLLLANNANPNAQDEKGQTPLHIFLRVKDCNKVANNSECILLLLKNGADVNVKDCGGQTPLHLATRYNYTKFLLVPLNK